MKYPYLPAKDIERAADGLLARAFGGKIPVPMDLEAILFDLLAEEEKLAFDDERVLGRKDGDRILGQMWPFRNRIEICASLKDPHSKGRRKGRYRFTVSHEIGHWVLHRPLHLESKTRRLHGLFGPADAQDRMVSLQRNVFATDSVSAPGRSPSQPFRRFIADSRIRSPSGIRSALRTTAGRDEPWGQRSRHGDRLGPTDDAEYRYVPVRWL